VYNGNGKSRPKIVQMFLAGTVQAGGPPYLPRLLFVEGFLFDLAL